MGARRNEDPVTWGDLLQIHERLSKVEGSVVQIYERMSRVEQDVSWLKATIQDIRDMLRELEAGVEGYKKWIVTGLMGGLVASSVFLAILRMFIGV